MNHTCISRQLSAIAGLLVMLLITVACTPVTPALPTDTPAPPTAAPPTETSTPEPISTEPSAPTAAPEATPTPEAAALLPAPLYFLDSAGQIMRLEIDGVTLSQIAHAAAAVTDFAVSQVTGQVAYVSGNELYLADAAGADPAVILTGPGPTTGASGGSAEIHSLHFSPAGGRIAFALEGVQIIDLATRATSIVQPDDAPGPGAGAYFPIAWSPDGTRLLINRAFYTTAGTLQINAVGYDSVVSLGAACCQPAWSASGQYVYVSGPYYGPRQEPGLRRYQSYDAAAETLIAFTPGSDALSLVAFARQLADGNLYAFFRATTTTEYTARSGLLDFVMVRSAADGVTDRVELRTDTHTLQEALWADDGRGAVIAEATGGATTGRPLLWLPSGGGPALTLPAEVPADSQGHLQWGATEAALLRAALEAQALTDLGITRPPEGVFTGIAGVDVLPLETGDGQQLWAVYTVGMRSYDVTPPQSHTVAIYARTDAGWQQLAQLPLVGASGDPEDFGPDYLSEGGVTQARVEPTHIWLEVRGGVGAHSGAYHLLSFAGSTLKVAAVGFSASPAAGGGVDDIDGDGVGEVVLDATDYYVFCYACGVRDVHFNVLRWDGAQMAPVALALLPEPAPAELRDLNNRAVKLAEAGLWKDAAETMNRLLVLSVSADDEALGWNLALINLNADAKREATEAEGAYPILENIFYGDYAAAVDLFRGYPPEQIFSADTPLLVGTVAQGMADAVVQQITTRSAAALEVVPDLAPAYFLRSWAAYLTDPASPDVLSQVKRAAELAPADALYAACVAFLE